MACKKFLITGRVQGVGFRFTVLEKAKDFSLHGFVENQLDGSVLIIASGTDGNLTQLEHWLKSTHTPGHIDNILVTEYPDEDFRSFSIRY